MPERTEGGGVRLEVAYDGTAFAGWQVQPRQRTVQGELVAAVAKMEGRRVQVRGASRTDSGVHALAQVAAFDTAKAISADGWMRGLNGALPSDIAIKDAQLCAAEYNPRYDALSKRYRYLVQVGRTRDPLSRNRCWYVQPGLLHSARRRSEIAAEALNLPAMERAAEALIGTHDFAAFRASNDYREQTVRTLSSLRLLPGFDGTPSLLAIEVHGNAFLKNMVRIIAGTLVEVGRGRMTPEYVRELVTTRPERTEAGPTAPPQGLTLLEVELGRRGVD